MQVYLWIVTMGTFWHEIHQKYFTQFVIWTVFRQFENVIENLRNLIMLWKFHSFRWHSEGKHFQNIIFKFRYDLNYIFSLVPFFLAPQLAFQDLLGFCNIAPTTAVFLFILYCNWESKKCHKIEIEMLTCHDLR